MEQKTINMAIQVLPQAAVKHPYAIVDDAIKIISGSGFPYKVCPFETVVECTLEEALALIRKIHEQCRLSGADALMTYIKIQTRFSDNVTIEDKMEKYH
jgi:uncharacterized protein YqgV (UPF0045/DUF77 family)